MLVDGSDHHQLFLLSGNATMENNMKNTLLNPERLIGGKTISEWDHGWVPVKGGFVEPHPELRRKVGLYRAVLNGEVVCIGQAIEYANGGLAKRAADFRRPSPSGRSHRSGNLIRENLPNLQLQILCVGSDRKAGELAAELRAPMVALHRPCWNVPEDIVLDAIINSRSK